MSTVKISQLPVITGANTAADDVIPIVDVSGNSTNKITREEFFKNIQGNVGIGTSSPAGKLHVSGSAAAVSTRVANTDATGMATVEFSDGTNTKGQIWAGNGSYASFGGAGSMNYSANSGPHVWYTDYTERLRIDASGNLGLGVVPSAWNTSLKAAQIGTLGSVFSGGGTTYFGHNFYSGASNNVYLTTAAASFYQQDGTHKWFTAPSGTAGDPITFTQTMTLDASGNLLIGTTSSGASKLRISGLPTSSAGLSAGDVWNDGGTLKIA